MLYSSTIKPAFDFFVASALTLVLSPLLVMLTVAGAIQFGNPFFVQSRSGKGGAPFPVLKFKSMLDNPEMKEEDRITKYGWLIRRFSLDELAQLFNVLSGQMSLVGPRPLPHVYLPKMSDEQRWRFKVKPGLTGLSQTMGRNQLSWESKFLLDGQYIERLSFKTDLTILLKTVPVLITGAGIHHEGFATMPVFEGNEKRQTSRS